MEDTCIQIARRTQLNNKQQGLQRGNNQLRQITISLEMGLGYFLTVYAVKKFILHQTYWCMNNRHLAYICELLHNTGRTRIKHRCTISMHVKVTCKKNYLFSCSKKVCNDRRHSQEPKIRQRWERLEKFTQKGLVCFWFSIFVTHYALYMSEICLRYFWDSP